MLQSISVVTVLAHLPAACAVGAVCYIFVKVVFNLWLHPLAKYPGPKYAAASDVFYSKTVVGGSSHEVIRKLHERYGDVVRIAPNELSFATASAWKDIYATRPGVAGGSPFLKDPKFYVTDDEHRAIHVVNAKDPEQHAQIRKTMSYAFSAKAILEQEELIIGYADMLTVAVEEEGQKGPLNLVEMFNWTTFDILGELGFGEPFGSLQKRKTDERVAVIFDLMKQNNWDVALSRFPLAARLQQYIIPRKVVEGAKKHVLASRDKIMRRLEEKTDRKDFVSYIFRDMHAQGTTGWQLAAHANALIIAGSETTGTLLSGLFFYTLSNRQIYSSLQCEIRSAFTSVSQITSKAVTELKYTTAVINEAFRIYPPIPIGMPRVSSTDQWVSGHFVPAGTTVSVHMWSVTHNPANFREPFMFMPERWLDGNQTDSLDASQPFLIGTRGCMGRNLAWIELRVLIAKLVWLFDFELVPGQSDWETKNKCFILWEKPDLWVCAKRRTEQS